MTQPTWKFVANLGDVSPLDHGGLFIFVDETGVYAPEIEKLERITDDDCDECDDRYRVYRTVCEPCTHIDGILSDNRFHSAYSAWFADELGQIASFVGLDTEALIEHFTSAEPIKQALAWQAVGDYHGWDNLDNYPLELSRAEAEQRLQSKSIPH